MNRRVRKGRGWKLALKAAVSALFVAWLVGFVDWREFADAARDSDPLLLGLVEVCVVLLVLLSAFKWQLLLALQGLRFRLSYLNKAYWIATFFNNFLPTMVGGDAVRVLYTIPGSGGRPSAPGGLPAAGEDRGAGGSTWQTAAAAVIVERLTGLVALVAIGYAASLLAVAVLEETTVSRWVAVIGAPLILAAALVLGAVLRPGGVRRVGLPTFPGKLLPAIASYRGRSGMAKVWLISFAFQAAVVAMFALLARAVGISVPVAKLFVIVPVFSLVAIVPISINGIGVSEAACVALFSAVGVEPERALLLGIAARVVVLPVSIVGGILFFFERDRGRGETARQRVMEA